MADRARPYIVVVSGTRRGLGQDELKLAERLDYHRRAMGLIREARELIIMHGDASGVDSLARDWASENGIFQMKIPAPWKRGGADNYDRTAGMDRNEFMIDAARTLAARNSLVYFEAFPDAQSIGTRGAIKYAKKFPDEILVHVTEIRA